jgi:hypothetical protein
MRSISFLERHQTEVIEKILRHGGLWEESPARGRPAALPTEAGKGDQAGSGGLRQAPWHGPLNAPVCPRRFQATAFPHRFEPSPSLLAPDAAFGFRPGAEGSSRPCWA